MNMLHENNQKAIAQWQAKDYANAYRNKFNGSVEIEDWFSGFMPEDENFSTICEFCMLCLKFHNMGFLILVEQSIGAFIALLQRVEIKPRI